MKTIHYKYLLFAAAVLCMLLLSARLIREDKELVKKPLLLLKKISVNGQPTDSIIYNERGRLAEIWFYDDITHRWDAHNKYIYGAQDKVMKVMEYWGDELMEIDSVYYRSTGFTRYSISVRSANVMADTLLVQTNTAGQPIRIGDDDTVLSENLPYVSYNNIEYYGSNPGRLIAFNYFQQDTLRGQYLQHEVITDQEYDGNPNPFTPLCQDYPAIAMETFDRNILFADASNNLVKQTTLHKYSGQKNATDQQTVYCSYQYDPVTRLPIEQSYVKYELDERDKPVRKKYSIRFYYQQP
ncbi:hypothetical protein SAMN05444266_106508 [Chitinophaga jiangningensis]|uniref:Uncharacterized protein n=1 Tax=Chitinophaga jiangningensis TaxID=1419482 RepID=A0A1M7GDG4_9BACT|nr:hypothetical protein [Chitinophaga jiangningensis]SHM14165.1 hypothetical protein SAMN05444266_106508 [Chitinophaga jiangningensis]